MFGNEVFRSRALVLAVVSAFTLLVIPVADFAQEPAAAQAGGSLTGYIYAANMVTPVPGAIVKIRDIDNPRAYESLPTDRNGMFLITGISEGRYILGVLSPDGEFNFGYILRIKSGQVSRMSLTLQNGAHAMNGEATPKKKRFFSSAVGVALLVAAAAAGFYLVYDKEEDVSPIR